MKNKNTDIAYKRQEYQFWRGCLLKLIILISIPLLFYSGYCYGLWGGNSLILQYLFQCNCPSPSEQMRYPKEVEVIISACQNSSARLLPSGQLLYVRENKDDHTSTYLLDLRTNEKIAFTLPYSSFDFLTDDLLYIFVYYEANEYLLDRSTNNEYPIKRFVYSHPGSYIDGNADPAKLVTALRQAKDIYFIANSTDMVVALPPNFPAHPELIFYFNRFDLQGFDPNRVEKFLQQNKISYQTPLPSYPEYPHEITSPSGKFIARPDGIYLSGSEKKIVEGYSFREFLARRFFTPRGWIYNGTGVIYTTLINPCLIGPSFFTGCHYKVPQPVLLLKMPEEYMPSTETP